MDFRVSRLVSGSILALSLITSSLSLVPFAEAQQAVLPLWPQASPEPPQTLAPEVDETKPTDALIDGRPTARLTNVSRPTLSVYPPHGHNTGTAALVFPGGGYVRLAWNGEGTDACQWLNSIGVTCLLVKYRVPQPAGDAGHYPADPSDLEDAQQAMRLARAHATEWHINPDHIGVVGFSAGGNLAVLLSTHPDDTHVETTPAASEVDPRIDARPNFAIIVYPAYLGADEAFTALDPTYRPNRFTPPTFLIQAENDRSYGRNALLYFRALLDANVLAELHYYATGGHGFGVFPVHGPEEHWTDLADTWLRYIHMIPRTPPESRAVSSGSTGENGGAPAQVPCPTPSQPPQPGRPDQTATQPNQAPNPTGTPCW